MKPLSVLSLLALGLCGPASLAQQVRSISAAEAPLADLNAGSLAMSPSGFEENKGQVTTTDGTPAPHVRFRLTQGGTAIFLLGDGIAFQFNRTHRPPGMDALEMEARHDPRKQQLDALHMEERLETFRMDMLLDGAAPNPVITTGGRSHDYVNYYTHDALDVRTYDRITYHDVYPGIDWVLYTTAQGMEHDFVVRPGADPSQVRLRFRGHGELRVDADGRLVHGNPLGRFIEAAPVSYQQGREVGTRFVLEDDPQRPGEVLLRFSLDAYDPSQVLTMDPARVWGTYYGSAADDKANACAVDSHGNLYFAGTTGSTNGIADLGHQNTKGGGTDAFLVKFSPAGVRIWGTYYGGNLGEDGQSCAVDSDDNVYLAGRTNSPDAIGSTGYQNQSGGYYDAFLVKFNPVGTRLWSTYFGGAGGEFGRSCAVDGDDNVYLAGYTNSDDGINNAGHQETFGGGNNDAFLAKFNAGGSLLWSTYYGGLQNDQGESCAPDADGNVYLVGYTKSSNAIAEGGYRNTLPIPTSLYSAFLVKFGPTGTRLWGTYYGGAGEDQGYACAVDGEGHVYLGGTTGSDTAMAVGAHQVLRGGGTKDAFLVKFDGDGTRLWGTYYGGGFEDQGYACAVDANGNVLLAGMTKSTEGIASSGHQADIGGQKDGFLAKFTPAGTRVWGTYYGGERDDEAQGCAVDSDGHAFLAGYTNSFTGIASDAAYDDTYDNTLSQAYDCFLAKFEQDCPTLQATVGDPCDDGDPGTENDVITADCGCAGTSTVGIAEQGALPGSSLSLHPNPYTTGPLTVHAEGLGSMGRSASIAILDASGKLVHQEELGTVNGALHVEMDLAGRLAPGLYAVRVTIGDRWVTGRLGVVGR